MKPEPPVRSYARGELTFRRCGSGAGDCPIQGYAAAPRHLLLWYAIQMITTTMMPTGIGP